MSEEDYCFNVQEKTPSGVGQPTPAVKQRGPTTTAPAPTSAVVQQPSQESSAGGEEYCIETPGTTVTPTERTKPTAPPPPPPPAARVEQPSPVTTSGGEEYCFSPQEAVGPERPKPITTTAVAAPVEQPGPTAGPVSCEEDQQPSFVDEIITKVLRSPIHPFTSEISEQEIHQLCNAAIEVFRQKPTLVKIQPPLVVCGDIHGQFSDLQRIFATHGSPPQMQYLFLGDYVDRGPQSMEVMILLFCYKVKHPDNFILLRGNHECANINKAYGFLAEIHRRFQQGNAQQLYDLFNQTFAWMPYVGLIGNKIMCMHGGISDRIISLDQLSQLRRPLTEPPLPSLEIDLLWADPKQGIQGVHQNTRGAGVTFGEDVVEQLCRQLDISYIVRAHQVVNNGVEYFANRKLITLFSAPRYANRMNNTGATLTIKEDLSHSITRFPPA